MRGFGVFLFAVSASLRLRKAAFDVSIHADAARFAVAATGKDATKPRRGVVRDEDVRTGPGIIMVRRPKKKDIEGIALKFAKRSRPPAHCGIEIRDRSLVRDKLSGGTSHRPGGSADIPCV